MPLVITDLLKQRVKCECEWAGEKITLETDPVNISWDRYKAIQRAIAKIEENAKTASEDGGPGSSDAVESFALEISIEFLTSWVVGWDIYGTLEDKDAGRPLPITRETLTGFPMGLLAVMSQAVMEKTEVDTGEGETAGASSSGARSSAPVSMKRRKN